LDVVIPGALTHSTTAKAPYWLPDAAQASIEANRTTRLFFIGALCWKLDVKVHTPEALEAKCTDSFSARGFLSRYSFGLRYQVWLASGGGA
jgi:hypothetical protein